ncbi:hypothetical protein UFOVP715_16 [uncultured Caudovirales phage]|jgi:hypothetical protein|uniref:Uncharacterized protein n=1 Tax=uncultured Caudovirales phage TaxID=2100421 RepID=A0A6J5NL38_9CAUD|nr:hypothetical protein UFOVP715_16 [uncultured Caudovirales phage]
MATGLIQDGMARPEGDELTNEAVSKDIKMPPELQEAYDRVVIAGMKVMFSKESHRAMLQEIQRPGPMGQRLGKGIAGLLLLLFKESNGTMPPAVMIPAGVKLLMEAVDFLRKSGLEKPTNADIGEGIQIMMTTVLEKFGVAPEKLEQMLNQYSDENIPEMGA